VALALVPRVMTFLAARGALVAGLRFVVFFAALVFLDFCGMLFSRCFGL
jgi:hypothetical protein